MNVDTPVTGDRIAAKKIDDYGIVGNLHAAALVGRDGSIDWLCSPTISSPALFAALLDGTRGGSFSITPCGEWDSVLSYMEDTNILVGRFRTRTGVYTLTDFMPVLKREEPDAQLREHVIVRLIQVQRGSVQVRVRFEPRFDYGRIVPEQKLFPGKGVVSYGGGQVAILSTSGPLQVGAGRAEAVWELREGERVALHLRLGGEAPEPVPEGEVEHLLRDTARFWRDWLYESGPGLFNDLDTHRASVVRSLLVLKLLYYEPVGTMAAAATTSLPESIGGVRNWDYRYSWVRDTSMALAVLFHVGHVEETEGYLTWLDEVILLSRRNELQVMYDLDGAQDLREEDLSHLDGYRGSRPVRIGNKAVEQKQFSIYGHVLIAAHLLAERKRTLDREMWHGLTLMCRYVTEHWDEPDSSIWEMRTQPKHFVHSKVMCWVTLDRGIRIARLTGLEGDVDAWRQACEAIRKDVLARGWSDVRQAFVLHYDADDLDGSSLLISLSEFLPYDDPRMVATVEAIRLDLAQEGLVRRYVADDGLPGKEGTFLPCTLWLVTNLARQGEIEEAELLLSMVDQVAGPLHLLAEEYDPEWDEQLGNFPQAFSHMAYITAAMAIAEAKGARRGEAGGGEPEAVVAGEAAPGSLRLEELADALDHVIHHFRTGRGKGAADAWRHVERAIGTASGFDPGKLESRRERLCFWTNLHSLVLLDSLRRMNIESSLREVVNFFRRSTCVVNGTTMSLELILHGILRGNRPAPGRLIPPLPPGDPRLRWSIRQADPRVLCTLSTACMSSPAFYPLRPETIHRDLDAAARAYVAERVRVDMERRSLLLPAIFRWYDEFGKAPRELLGFVARYLEGDQGRTILDHPESFTVRFGVFDWRHDRSRFPCE